MVTQIPVDALAATIDGVRGHLAQAATGVATARAEARVVDGFRTEVAVRGHTLAVDQSAPLGDDTGPTPVELLLASLASCQQALIAIHPRLLGVPLESMTVTVEGDYDPRGVFGVGDVPGGMSRIASTVDIRSSAAPAEVARLFDTVDRHCPVLAALQQPFPVQQAYTLNGQVTGE